MSSTAAASQTTEESGASSDTVTPGSVPETLEQRLLADVYQWTAGNSANFPGGGMLLTDMSAHVRSADVDWQSALIWHTPQQPQLEVDRLFSFRT